MTKTTTLCLLLLTVFSLSACSSIWPDPFYIEYDEEVKLHTGEIIVVHIKRQYTRGDAIPAIWQRKPSFAWAGPVEITWDTGFAGVGRKTVPFSGIGSIDKYDNRWVLSGRKAVSLKLFDGHMSNVKYIDIDIRSLVVLNSEGVFETVFEKNLIKNSFRTNIHEYRGHGYEIPYVLSGKKLMWAEKVELDGEAALNWRGLLNNLVEW